MDVSGQSAEPSAEKSAEKSEVNDASSSSEEEVKVFILSPSFPERFTFNLKLSTTVARLRLKIMQIIPPHLSPTEQRLIYSGRIIPQTPDLLTLRDILVPSGRDVYTIHLILPPTPMPISSTSQNTTSSFQAPGGAAQPQVEGVRHRVLSATPSPSQTRPARATANSRELDPMQADVFFRGLQGQVELIEREMAEGITPSMEFLFHVRTRIMQITEGRPLESSSSAGLSRYVYPEERDVQQLLARVMEVYRRMDQLLQDPSVRRDTRGTTVTPSTEPHVYLATSPNGYQALIMQPREGRLPPPEPRHPLGVRPIGVQHIGAQHAGAQPQQPNDGRQAVLNQQRQRNEPANAGAFARHFRRIWLFVRLYFFIYMISESGTWTRILFVTLAAFVALFSDSQLPQLLYGAIVAPVLRHLEALAHMGGPAEQPARAAVDGFWEYFWRAERAVVLLLASLVPGIGERQVRARNAAEAEAERLRQNAAAEAETARANEEEERARDRGEQMSEHLGEDRSEDRRDNERELPQAEI
ncbi:uncharacterized protein N7503_011907 [Penicillium pulvis]|uniref:uncharacterized protein n=1 Tax=Penicillium pulvis TaxID=1562058 RepID=UPI0025470EA2|nr:uncharacterized protein N7503_011907 [Penicillium pulvis]KAJ5786695.1 hypothetical protein N7503_011907 [Penicillium pulvis]